MNKESKIKEQLIFMLLPIPIGSDKAVIVEVIDQLENIGIDEDSYSIFLRLKFEEWRIDGYLDPIFKRVILNALNKIDEKHMSIASNKYFDLHELLLNNPLISFELASIILSQLRLIIFLAFEEKMSSAKIASVVTAINGRLAVVSWKEIQSILQKLKIKPELDIEKVKVVYQQDEEAEEIYFADADMLEASSIVGEVATNLKLDVDVGELLNTFLKDGATFMPYLQILHYQCLISGFYNHLLSFPYEFSPRGNVAGWLFSKYDHLVSTSNPILNNAKAVDQLNHSWARSRNASEFEQATALVNVLHAIDGLGYLPSFELSTWIRRWLVRSIKLTGSNLVDNEVPILDSPSIIIVINFIIEKPTQTFGVMEQRFVDVVSLAIHPKTYGWRNRGIGDSVHSNNLSKKKLGDSDFQDSDNRLVVAYEPHGGYLSRHYYEGHRRTFRRSLEKRIVELEGIADIADWRLKLIFVAYGFEAGLNEEFYVNGINIQVEYLTFEQLYQKVDVQSEEFLEIFNQFFIANINNRKTPMRVRQKINSLVSSI